MTTSVEQHEKKVSSIQASLDAIKNEALSDIEKQKKSAEIKKEAEAEKVSVEHRINELKDKTDAESINEKEKAQSQLDTLNNIIDVQLSVLTQQSASEASQEAAALQSEVSSKTSTAEVKNDGTSEEKKGFLGKTGEWIGDQWHDVRDGEKREEETGKNLLRTGGFLVTLVGAGALIYKGCKKLFGKDKKKDEGEDKESSDKKGKKDFRDRPIGKVVKWTGIGTLAYYVAHGISTGNWGIGDLFNWNKDERTETREDQIDAFNSLSIEEKEQYNKLGNTVNEFYGKLWDKEISLGYQDNNTLGTVVENIQLNDGKIIKDYEGLVPFCIDSGVKNIEELLSEKDLNECAFNKDYNDLKNKVKGWTTEKLENILGPFVSKLASFSVFGKKTGLSLGEKIKQWLDYDEDSRENELNSFFRQYTKVLSFIKDKERLLQYKIAEDEIKKHGYNNKSLPTDEEGKLDLIEEALEDGERYDVNVKNNSIYKEFMNSKLLSCNKVLEKNNMMNGNSSSVLNEIISKLDKQTDSLLQIEDGESILDRGISEIPGELSGGTKDDLIEMCNDLKDDIIDETGTGFMQEYLEWISYACNMDDSNKKTFLEESGLVQICNGYISTIDEYREKIKRGEATKEDLEKLKEISLAYIAFKKEMYLAIHTMSSIKTDNPDAVGRVLNTSLKMVNGFCKSLTHIIGGKGKFGDWASLGVMISVAGGSLYIIKHPGKVLIGTLKGTINGIGWVISRPGLSSRGLKKYIKSLPTSIEKKSCFLHYVLKSGNDMNEDCLLRVAREAFNIDESSLEKVLAKMDLGISEDEAKIILKYSKDQKLRKMCVTESISSNANLKDRLLMKKTARKFEVTAKNKEIIHELGKIDSKIESADKGIKNVITSMIKRANNIEDMKSITNLVEDQKFMDNIGKLSKTELKQLKTLKIKDFKDFQQKIVSGEIRTVKEYFDSIGRKEVLSDTRKAFNETIDRAISKFNELPAEDMLRKTHVPKLEALKSNTSLIDDEMGALVRFTKNGFPAEDLPDLIKLFKLEQKFGPKNFPLGKHLQDLLENGRYTEFKGILCDPQYGKILKNIDRTKLINNFKNVEKNLFKNVVKNMDDFMKLTMKTIAKIL